MPLKPERIGAETFLPWAANLLPEKEQLRAVGQFLGMSPVARTMELAVMQAAERNGEWRFVPRKS